MESSGEKRGAKAHWLGYSYQLFVPEVRKADWMGRQRAGRRADERAGGKVGWLVELKAGKMAG